VICFRGGAQGNISIKALNKLKKKEHALYVYCRVQCVFYVEVKGALFLHSNPEGSDDTLKPAGDCGG